MGKKSWGLVSGLTPFALQRRDLPDPKSEEKELVSEGVVRVSDLTSCDCSH